MAAEIFEFVGKTRRGEGLALATEILDSGKAYKKMIEIIKAQGGKEIMPDTLAVGKYSHVVRAESRGKISHIDNIAIARIARMAGTPADKPAGILLHKHAGDVVAKGEQLYTLYSESEEKLKYAIELIHQSSGFLIVEK
jgi:thymidine phosphorylase